MAPRCHICTHPQRLKIEAALVERSATHEEIARRWGLTRRMVGRHRRLHLSNGVMAARLRGDPHDLLKKLETLDAESMRGLRRARQKRDGGLARSWVQELRRNLELRARMLGELKDAPLVNVALVASPEWQRVRAEILSALEAFPEARVAVAQRLLALEGGGRDLGEVA